MKTVASKNFADLVIKCWSHGSPSIRIKPRLENDQYVLKAVFPCHRHDCRIPSLCRLSFEVGDHHLAGTSQIKFPHDHKGAFTSSAYIEDFAQDRTPYPLEIDVELQDIHYVLAMICLRLPKSIADEWAANLVD